MIWRLVLVVREVIFCVFFRGVIISCDYWREKGVWEEDGVSREDGRKSVR